MALLSGLRPSDREEDFRPTNGSAIAWLGETLIVGFVAVSLFQEGVDPPAWVVAAVVTLGILLWAALLRPRVWIAPGDELVLRTMFETVTIPLAAIESIVVRQVLVVTAGGRRFTCAALGHTRRRLVRGSGGRGGGGGGGGGLFGSRGGYTGEAEQKPRALGVDYPDFVESRLTERHSRAMLEHRVRRGSEEQQDLARRVRRQVSWPVIAVVAAALVVTVVLAVAS